MKTSRQPGPVGRDDNDSPLFGLSTIFATKSLKKDPRGPINSSLGVILEPAQTTRMFGSSALAMIFDTSIEAILCITVLQQLQIKKLVAIQDDARKKFPPIHVGRPDEVTYCNIATKYIVEQLGAPLGPFVDKNGAALLATPQAENLANSTEWKEQSEDAVQSLANNGVLVVAASASKVGHGHIATARPQGIPGDHPPANGRGPLLNNIGDSVGVMNKNWAFLKGQVVHYYSPK